MKNFFKKIWSGYRNWLGDVKWYKNWKFWLSVVIFIAIGSSGSSKDEVVEAEEPKVEDVGETVEKDVDVEDEVEKEVEEEPKQKSEDDLIEEFDEAGKKAFGDEYVKTNILWDVENAVYYEDGSYNPDESVIDIINVKTFLTSSQIRRFLMSSTKLLEEFQDVDFNRIHISGDGKFTDQYGKETDQNATYIEITKDTIDKINFDNFKWENLPGISDNFWMHQSMDTKGLD